MEKKVAVPPLAPSPARVFPLGGGPMSTLLALSDHCLPKAAPAAVVAR
jgi:hypothetical protein